MYTKSKQQGFVVIASVLIVSSIILSIALSIVFVNINVGTSILLIKNSDQARMLANTCSEIALQRIAMDITFSGGEVINFPEGRCSYNVVVGSGEIRTIESLGEFRNSVRRERISISSLRPDMNIFSWQELGDF